MQEPFTLFKSSGMAKQDDPIFLLGEFYFSWRGKHAVSIVPLPESGSYRRYFRISDGDSTVMGVYNTDSRENDAFIYLNRHLLKTGNRVPVVYCEDLKKSIYLEQDLGDTTLLDYLEQIKGKKGEDDRIRDIYRKAINAMPGLQVDAHNGVDYSICYPRAEFDVQSMMWDMNYFKYCLLKPLKIEFFEQDLEDDFRKIVDWLAEAERNSFMFRDFQSRNIMICDRDLYFIDFQGGRKGPLQYDLSSLLYEAKTHLHEDIRQDMLDHYLHLFETTFSWFRPDDFLKYYYGFVYLRLMQAMGAYGFRGYIERKPLFLQSLPHAVRTLGWLIKNKPMPLNLVSLPGVFEKLAGMPKIQEYDVKHEVFTVTISSFAYKNGIPHDTTGNGGGFVFDCRCLINPGRLDEFRNLTGKDEPVIRFLENDSVVSDFLSHTRYLVEQAIDVYMKRGFSSLMVSYGCTGGQHRSVFMAESLAAGLKGRYPIHLVVSHQELEKNKPL
jgi:aminoglycoside/choline kinase family phosphotransferase